MAEHSHHWVFGDEALGLFGRKRPIAWRTTTAILVTGKSIAWPLLAGVAFALLGTQTAQAGITDPLIGTLPSEVAQALGPARILPPSEDLGGGDAETEPGTSDQVTTWVRVDDVLRSRRGDTERTLLGAGNRGLELSWELPERRALRVDVVEGWSSAEYAHRNDETKLAGRATTTQLAYGPIRSALGLFDLQVTQARGSLSGTSTLVSEMFRTQGAGEVDMSHNYSQARAVLRMQRRRWRAWADIAAARVSADLKLSSGRHALVLPMGQEGMAAQVRVVRRTGPGLWAAAAGVAARLGRGQALYNQARAGTTESRFGSRYLGIGWRRTAAAREWDVEVARFSGFLSLQAFVLPPPEVSPLPETEVQAQAQTRGRGTMARVGMRRPVGAHTLLRAGLLHLRGSASYGAGYDVTGLGGLVHLADESVGQEYPAFRLWVLGLGVEHERRGWRLALGAAQGFGETGAARKKPGGPVSVPGERVRSQGGRAFVLSVGKRW